MTPSDIRSVLRSNAARVAPMIQNGGGKVLLWFLRPYHAKLVTAITSRNEAVDAALRENIAQNRSTVATLNRLSVSINQVLIERRSSAPAPDDAVARAVCPVTLGSLLIELGEANGIVAARKLTASGKVLINGQRAVDVRIYVVENDTITLRPESPRNRRDVTVTTALLADARSTRSGES